MCHFGSLDSDQPFLYPLAGMTLTRLQSSCSECQKTSLSEILPKPAVMGFVCTYNMSTELLKMLMSLL